MVLIGDRPPSGCFSAKPRVPTAVCPLPRLRSTPPRRTNHPAAAGRDVTAPSGFHWPYLYVHLCQRFSFPIEHQIAGIASPVLADSVRPPTGRCMDTAASLLPCTANRARATGRLNEFFYAGLWLGGQKKTSDFLTGPHGLTGGTLVHGNWISIKFSYRIMGPV